MRNAQKQNAPEMVTKVTHVVLTYAPPCFKRGELLHRITTFGVKVPRSRAQRSLENSTALARFGSVFHADVELLPFQIKIVGSGGLFRRIG
jgi:hypothetical protein